VEFSSAFGIAPPLPEGPTFQKPNIVAVASGEFSSSFFSWSLLHDAHMIVSSRLGSFCSLRAKSFGQRGTNTQEECAKVNQRLRSNTSSPVRMKSGVCVFRIRGVASQPAVPS